MRRLFPWIVLLFSLFIVLMAAGACAPGIDPTLPAANEGAGLPPPGESWDLVYLTDSTGWGVAYPLAARASDDLGVYVQAHDLTHPGLRAEAILTLLAQERFAAPVRGAEIVVVFGNPRQSGVDLPQPDIGTCVSTSSKRRPPPAVSTQDDWTPYRQVLGDVMERIWELRDGRATVIRAVDMYTPVLRQWREAGIADACTREWTMMSNQVRAAAEAHGVQFVSVYDALNGPAHDRDLLELDWVRSDGEHLNSAGAQAIADAIAAAGFDPLPAP